MEAAKHPKLCECMHPVLPPLSSTPSAVETNRIPAAQRSTVSVTNSFSSGVLGWRVFACLMGMIAWHCRWRGGSFPFAAEAFLTSAPVITCAALSLSTCAYATNPAEAKLERSGKSQVTAKPSPKQPTADASGGATSKEKTSEEVGGEEGAVPSTLSPPTEEAW